MMSDFFFLWFWLNLLSFLLERQQKLRSSGILFEAVIYFEYNKIEERYWIGKYLLDQIKNKALSIVEALYLEYKLLFMFDNTTSHTIYVKDIL